MAPTETPLADGSALEAARAAARKAVCTESDSPGIEPPLAAGSFDESDRDRPRNAVEMLEKILELIRAAVEDPVLAGQGEIITRLMRARQFGLALRKELERGGGGSARKSRAAGRTRRR